MLLRIGVVAKELWRTESRAIRSFTSMGHPNCSEQVVSSPPRFPPTATPLPQPLYVPVKAAANRPPMLDIPPESDPLLVYITSWLMAHGKRHAAARRTSRLLLHLHAMTRSPPLPILREAVSLAAPSIRIVSHKTGGKIVQKPIPLNEKQRTRYAVKWILDASKDRFETQIEVRLAWVILDIIKRDPKNPVLKKKADIHQLGMVNRASANVRV